MAGLIAAIRRRPAHRAFATLCGAVTYVAAFIFAMNVGSDLRTLALEEAADRNETIIAAIERYSTDHGGPPESLDALVPDYLPETPWSGLGAYPKLRYLTGEETRGWAGNPWILMIDTPSGPVDFDRFVYFPNGNYPETGLGGPIEKIGRWAYVHE